MGPCHKRASHTCKPFFISVDPSPLPTPHGLGHGSRGTFAFGLEGLQPRPAVFAFPPFFSGAPHPLCLPGPTLLRPTCLSPACSTHWCWCPILAPIRSPRPAMRLPPAGVAPLYSALQPHPFSCLQASSRVAMVMRIGYRASNGTQVVAAFTPSANFMFHIYRGLTTPLWGGAATHCPALRSLPPPLTPLHPPPIFSSSWSSRPFSVGLDLWTVIFSQPRSTSRSLFYLYPFSWTVCYI